jgi:hypothetical protein
MSKHDSWGPFQKAGPRDNRGLTPSLSTLPNKEP